jgi:hypothetical protein
MRKGMMFVLKRLIATSLVLSVLLGMVTVFAAGTASDPLISRSYLEGTYRLSLIDAVRTAFSPAITAPMSKLNEIERNYTNYEFAPGFTEISARLSETVCLSPGASFTLTSGSATLRVNSGTVINVSTGTAVAAASQLTRNQRYFCAEDTSATITASSAMIGFVDGYYRTNSTAAPEPPPTPPNLPEQPPVTPTPPPLTPIDHFVIGLYRNMYRRDPEAAELEIWANQLRSGRATGSSIVLSLIFSNEFTRRNVSNTTFVDILYLALMNRNADSEGRTHWVNQLNAGIPRESVLSGFINSTEFDRRCRQIGITTGSYTLQAADMNRIFVTRMYVEALGRQPDTSGLNHWVTLLRNGTSGTTVAHGFVFSTESTRRNLSNDAFVEMLYRTMFGRASDPAGKTSWVNSLNRGTSRQSVFNSFASSTEFERLCRNHGIRR